MTEAELKREREERKGREGEMKSIMAFRAYMQAGMKPYAWKVIKLL